MTQRFLIPALDSGGKAPPVSSKKCWQYDGVAGNDYVICPGAIMQPSKGTFSCWVRLLGGVGGPSQCLMNSGALNSTSYAIWLSHQTLNLALSYGDGDVLQTTSANSPLTINTPTHLTGTWNGLSVALYKDAVEVISANNASLSGWTGNRLIGSINSSTGNMNARITDIRYYNESLTPDEIRWLAGKSGNKPADNKLLANYQTEEVAPSTVAVDSSGQGNNGTITTNDNAFYALWDGS